MLKPFSGEKIQSRQNGAQKWRFWEKMGIETLDFGFETPKRHFLVTIENVYAATAHARNHVTREYRMKNDNIFGIRHP